jgi:class 3 adenylate cyclase
MFVPCHRKLRSPLLPDGAGVLSTGLPTGTVTFFFSDIEGSTRLLGSLGDQAFAEILDSHHHLVREALAAHDGTEIATEGDSFFVVFIDPAQALAAAVSIQIALATGPWPNAPRISVRIGLHTGKARLVGTTTWE